MQSTHLVIVSDDQTQISRVEQFAKSIGLECQVKSNADWERLVKTTSDVPSLVGGGSVDSAKVLAFPGNTSGGHSDGRKSVSTINQLESVAIENAIAAFRGNLTEAAKALGIGRATLYRKVKQYNIDPVAVRTSARKNKAA